MCIPRHAQARCHGLVYTNACPGKVPRPPSSGTAEVARIRTRWLHVRRGGGPIIAFIQAGLVAGLACRNLQRVLISCSLSSVICERPACKRREPRMGARLSLKRREGGSGKTGFVRENGAPSLAHVPELLAVPAVKPCDAGSNLRGLGSGTRKPGRLRKYCSPEVHQQAACMGFVTPCRLRLCTVAMRS